MEDEKLFNKHLKLLIKYRNLILKNKFKNIFANEKDSEKQYLYKITVLYFEKNSNHPKIELERFGDFKLPKHVKLKNINLGSIETTAKTELDIAKEVIVDSLNYKGVENVGY